MRETIIILMLMTAACAGSTEAAPEPTPPDGPADEVGSSRVWIEPLAGDETRFELRYARGAAKAGPRVAEVMIDRSANLELVGYQAGDAATLAGKQVVVQEPSPDQLRVLLFSPSSITELGSGVLATLQLRRSGAAGATLDLNTSKPIFAPAPANEGLAIGDPLHLD